MILVKKTYINISIIIRRDKGGSCRYFQHAHFIPIMDAGKRGAG